MNVTNLTFQLKNYYLTDSFHKFYKILKLIDMSINNFK